MPRRRSSLRDFAPTQEELDAAKTEASAGQDGSTWGSAIGTGLGAVGGGLLGSLAGPGGAMAGAGLGASVGGGLGSAIGGAVGSAQADKASDKLHASDAARQKAIEDEQAYQEALDRFLRQG